jgi:predicted ATPase
VGKTRLAIDVATQVAGDFADGAAFVDLAPLRDPGLVLPTIAQRLGLDERHAPSLHERLLALLRAKHLLLLLDNFEHLVAAQDDILDLLGSCQRLTVLATSRVALRVRGEREYRVAPLELPAETDQPKALAQSAAVALFLERARAVGAELALTGPTASTVAQICRRLDGLPLAIELAAAWARLLPLSALLARLDRRLPLLVGGPHDLPTRQRTMRDAIAWSYDLLTGEEQTLFRRLAVFAGGCTVEAAEAVCGETGEQSSTLIELAALLDRSLLRRQEESSTGTEPPRLVMLETLREYGLEQLEASGEAETLRHRHAAHYLALAEAAEPELNGPHGREWGVRLEREHDNLRAALRWVLDSGNGQTGLRLVGALWRFWSARGHLSEGGRWLREVLAATADTATSSPDARGKALAGAATLAIERGTYDEAAGLCAEAITLAREQGTRRDLVAVLNVDGMLLRLRDEYREAEQSHAEALAVAREIGDRAGAAAALSGLAYATVFAGDVARGGILAEEAMAALREVGDTRALAEVVVGVAAQALHAGAFTRVEALGGEALALFRALGDTGRIADTLWMLGVAMLFKGQQEGAVPLFEECLALYRERGDERGAIQVVGALGQTELHLGRHQRARTLLEQALATARRHDDRWGQAMLLVLLGHVALAVGAPERAAMLLAESAPLFRAIGNPLYVPWYLEGTAGVAAAREAWERAARLCGARDALRARLGSPLPAADPASYERMLERARAALGEVGFAATHAEGSALTLEAALAEGMVHET